MRQLWQSTRLLTTHCHQIVRTRSFRCLLVGVVVVFCFSWTLFEVGFTGLREQGLWAKKWLHNYTVYERPEYNQRRGRYSLSSTHQKVWAGSKGHLPVWPRFCSTTIESAQCGAIHSPPGSINRSGLHTATDRRTSPQLSPFPSICNTIFGRDGKKPHSYWPAPFFEEPWRTN